MVYYVDGAIGNDANTGNSRQTAFRTLEKVNNIILHGGDKVLFRAGQEYSGCLIPKRADDDGEIIFDRYGVGEPPLIKGNGEAAVDICDINNIHVRRIAVTNHNGLFGIRIINNAGGEMKHIHITDCHVYDVYGGHDEFFICTGGIVMTSGKENAAWFRDLLIQDNYIHDVCRTGVILHTYWSNRPWPTWAENQYVSDTENWYPSYEVIWRGNKVERPAGDAMVLIGAIEPLIEWNIAYDVMNDPKPPCANAGIWPQSTEHCIVQYNEVGYAHKPKGCDDAQGFDVDLSCRNTVIQYNYSHDNDGGFLLLCELPGTADYGYTGTIVRNNLSVNDGNVKGELMALVGPVRGVTIENNTIYTSGNLRRLIQVWTGDGTDQAKDVTVRNNLFISNGLGNEYVLWNGENFKFENNMYWGEYRSPGPGEKTPRIENPHLPVPATGRGREVAENYVPSANSAAFQYAATPLKPAEHDFFGNPTKNRAYIGAFAGGKLK